MARNKKVEQIISNISKEEKLDDVRRKDKKVHRKRGSEGRIEYIKLHPSDINKRLFKIIEENELSMNKPYESFNTAMIIFINEIKKEVIANKISYRFKIMNEDLLIEYYPPRKIRNPAQNIDGLIAEEKIQLKMKSKRYKESEI